MSNGKYKIHMMINSSTTVSGVEKIVEDVKAHIAKLGGQMQTKHIGQLTKLDTPIKKKDAAWYAFMLFTLDKAHVAKLRGELALIEGLDRVLVLTDENGKHASFDVVSEKDYRKRKEEFWQENLIMENPQILKFFLSPRGRIMPRKTVAGLVGLDSKALMRQFANAVKQARFMGWLPLK